MKTLSYILVLFVLSLLSTTCSKNDTVVQEQKGEFIIDGEKFGLHRGGIWYFMEHPDNVYNFTVELYSSGIIGDINEGISGYGDLVSLMISSLYSDFPESGIYTIVSEDEAGDSGGAILSLYTGVHLENNSEVAEKYYVCIAGTLVFIKVKDEYEITVDAVGREIGFNTDEVIKENIEINIHYKGDLFEQLGNEEQE